EGSDEWTREGVRPVAQGSLGGPADGQEARWMLLGGEGRVCHVDLLQRQTPSLGHKVKQKETVHRRVWSEMGKVESVAGLRKIFGSGRCRRRRQGLESGQGISASDGHGDQDRFGILLGACEFAVWQSGAPRSGLPLHYGRAAWQACRSGFAG